MADSVEPRRYAGTGAISRQMGPAEWGMLFGLSVLWGGSFFFIGVAVQEVPPITVMAARVAIAAVALLAMLRLTGERFPAIPRLWLLFMIIGLINNAIPFTLIAWGQSHIASGVAAILNGSTPLLTVIVAHFLTDDEKATPGRVLGVLIGLGGVAVMVGGAAFETLGIGVVAQLAIVAAALSYAFAGVYARRFRRLGVSPMATATGQVVAATVWLVPVSLMVDSPWTLPAPEVHTVAAIVALGLVSTAFAYVIFFRLLARAGATNLLLVTLLAPVTATALGVSILGEVLQLRHGAGMLLIALGLAAIDGRPWAVVRRRVNRRFHGSAT